MHFYVRHVRMSNLAHDGIKKIRRTREQFKLSHENLEKLLSFPLETRYYLRIIRS